MALTPGKEKKLREEIRKQLAEQEKRFRSNKQQEEEKHRSKMEERIRARIKQEEEERFYSERGYVKYINRYGETEWLNPEEAEQRKSSRRSQKTSSRRKKHQRKKIIRVIFNLGLIGFAFLVFLFVYKFMPSSRADYGMIYVETGVPGAKIYLDGIDTRNFTPDTLGRITAGNHYISVYKEGFSVWPPMSRISVKGNQVTRVQFELKNTAILGALKINCNVPDYKLFIDGVPYGMENGGTVRVPVGYHVVSIVKAGFLARPLHHKILVEENQVQNVDFKLEPDGEIGYLQISSNEARGYIYLDNQFTGLRATNDLFPVKAGIYEIHLKENGFISEPEKQLVNILPNENRLLIFRMDPVEKTEKLEIKTQIPGAAIIIDGVWQPFVTPVKELELSPGLHFFNLMRNGKLYAEKDRAINLAQMKERSLVLNF